MNKLKIKRMTLIFILSIGTAILAIGSGWLQYKEKLDTTEKALAKEKELKEVYKKLEGKSDEIITLQKSSQDGTNSIIALQKSTQEKTEQIVTIQNKLQEKTELTVKLNEQLLESQQSISSDYERGLNPLFPMSISMDVEFPFSNYMFPKELQEQIYLIKKNIEAGIEYNKNDINVQWNEKKNDIIQLDFNDESKFPTYGLNTLFFKERTFTIRLQDIQVGIDSEIENKSIIFSGSITHSFGTLGGYSIAMVNFVTKTITVRCVYNGVTLFEPKNNKPIGVSDLKNKYLLVSPDILLGDYNISRFHIQGGSIYSQYSLYVTFSKHDVINTGGFVEYIHKLQEDEINTTRTRQTFK